METLSIWTREREKARQCLECTYSDTARPEHAGLAYTCVKHFDKAACPFWNIYLAERRALEARATARG